MKRILFTILAVFSLAVTAIAQSMKVYQNGQLKAIYYVSKDDKIEFSDDFPFPDSGEGDNKSDQDDTPGGSMNNHEYVDLGLPSGLKWATCNVGANKPEDCGYYYAWGETEPKAEYYWNNYFDSVNGSSSDFGKYATNKKRVLDPEDDVAHVKWGGDWRMPTYDELNELKTKCTWKLGSQNGVNGYTVVGPNGNSLFLPAAGYRDGSDLRNVGAVGYYWSSSLSVSNSGANEISFDLRYVSSYGGLRNYGNPVRPVCQ